MDSVRRECIFIRVLIILRVTSQKVRALCAVKLRVQVAHAMTVADRTSAIELHGRIHCVSWNELPELLPRVIEKILLRVSTEVYRWLFTRPLTA